jgi:hypothetical protein
LKTVRALPVPSVSIAGRYHHNHVIKDIDEFQLEKYGLKKSIKMALHKNRHLLESYLDSSDEDEDEDDDDSEEEEEEEKDQPTESHPFVEASSH